MAMNQTLIFPKTERFLPFDTERTSFITVSRAHYPGFIFNDTHPLTENLRGCALNYDPIVSLNLGYLCQT